MLKNALVSGDLGLEAVQGWKSLERGRIDPRRRAETLSVEEFVRLADLLASRDGMVVASATAIRGD